MHFTANQYLSGPLIYHILNFSEERTWLNCSGVSRAFREIVKQQWINRVERLCQQPLFLRTFGNIHAVAYQKAPFPFLKEIYHVSCIAKERGVKTDQSRNAQGSNCIQAPSLIQQTERQIKLSWAFNLHAFFEGVAKQNSTAQEFLGSLNGLSLTDKAEKISLWFQEKSNQERIATIEVLDLGSKSLTFLPHEISLFKGLRKLNLDHNKLASLPGSIGLLINLQELSLNQNQLKTLPPEIGLLVNLHALYLGQNQLTSLPDCIELLVKLQILYLRMNQLQALPSALFSLVNLQTLHLGDNRLTSIPPSLGSLVNLKHLNLDINQLTLLPESIGSLLKLQTLNLHDNQLALIPTSIKMLVELRVLTLSRNPLKSLPKVAKSCHIFR